MEGLEAKTQLLKATFEDLSNNVIGSQLVSSLLSLGNVVLQFANTGIGRFITQVVLLTTTLWGLSQVIKAMGIKETLLAQFKALPGAIKAVISAIKGATTATAAFNAVSKASLPLIGTITTLVAGAISIFSSFGNKVEKLESQLDECTTALESFQAEADELSQKAELTPAEEARLAYLYAMIEAEKELQGLTANRLYQAKAESVQYGGFADYIPSNLSDAQRQNLSDYIDIGPYDTINLDEYLAQQILDLQYYQDAIADIDNQINGLDKTSADYADTVIMLGDEQDRLRGYYNDLLEDVTPKVQEFVEVMDDMAEEDIPEAGQLLIDLFAELYPAAEDAAQGASDLGDGLSDTTAEAQSLTDSLKGLSSAYDTLSGAVEEYNSTGSLSLDTLAALLELDDDYLSMLDFENGQLTLNTEALNLRIDSLKQEAIQQATVTAAEKLAAIAAGDLSEQLNGVQSSSSTAQSGLDSYTSILQRVADGSLTATAGVMALSNAMANVGATSWRDIKMGLGATSSTEAAVQSVMDEYYDTIKLFNSVSIGGGGSGSGGGGGGGSSSTSNILEEHQKLIDETVKDLEHEIFLLEEQDAGTDTLIDKYKNLQDYVHQQADWFRSQGLDDNSDYIQDLQKQWWDYADKIKDIYQDIEDTWEENRQATLDWLQEDIDAYETLFSVVSDRAQEEIDALEAQKDLLQAQNDELNEQIELEETLDALARARQTKVLVYKDGRYQYVEDIDEVSSAQSDLEKLRQEQELQDRLDAIDKEIEYWEDYKDAWSSVVDNYETEQNKLLLSQKFGITLEGENWQLRLGNLAQYVNEYNGLMDSLKSFENMTFGGSTGKPSGVDWSQIWWDAENDTSLSEEKRTQIQNWAHAQKADELKGTGAKYDEASGTWYYAKGTTSAQGGMSLVGEEGAELRVLNKGDGIIPADVTRNLWSWGMTTPAQMMSNIVNTAGQSKSYNITISNLNLPEVKDGPSFVEYMKNNIWRKAIQLTV